MHEIALVWFRRDLRLADNPALLHAIDHARAVIPVCVEPPAYSPGDAACAWRERSLVALDASLEVLGSRLSVADGPAHEVLPALARESGATLVAFNRVWDPASRAEESRVVTALREAGVDARAHEAAHLVAPGSLLTHAGTPFRVFTPFHRAWERVVRAEVPLAAPTRIVSPPRAPAGTRRPAASSGRGLHEMWQPGEAGAAGRLERFAEGALASYEGARDLPAVDGTSGLSPHLAAGEVSPRQVLHAVRRSENGESSSADAFVRQLAWRDFSASVLAAAPELAAEPLRPEFAAFPWREDPDAFDRWCTGTTGFPLVDAGMRQLAATGWMHNRVRLVAASLLTKDLLIPWQRGEEFFRHALVDYDPAANAFNWQWVAGSGADAAPYFRIFNPQVQARRFDPNASYARVWIPELDSDDYPEPMVDHAFARERALGAYGSIRDATS